MEMRTILLASAVLCSFMSIAFSHVGKACDDSARPIDDVTHTEFEIWVGNKYLVFPRDIFNVKWVFRTPSDIDIEKEGNIVVLKCDSGEIKGKGELKTIQGGEGNDLQYFKGDGSTKLEKNRIYSLEFKGKFEKAPKFGDDCVVKIYFTLNDEEKSYCTTDEATITTVHMP